MTALVFFTISFLLTVGFLALVMYEQTHHVRFFENVRTRADRRIVAFTSHVRDAHVEEEISRLLRAFTHRVLHDITATALFGVRLVERELTKLVRSIRRKKEVLRSEGSAYVRTMAEYKHGLREKGEDDV